MAWRSRAICRLNITSGGRGGIIDTKDAQDSRVVSSIYMPSVYYFATLPSEWLKRQLDNVCPAPKTLLLKVGAQVMLVKNRDVKV